MSQVIVAVHEEISFAAALVGTSANSLHIQIWTALIALLLLKYLQLKETFGWSLRDRDRAG